MKGRWMVGLLVVGMAGFCNGVLPTAVAAGDGASVWPPLLIGAETNGTVTITSNSFLKIPAMMLVALTNGAVPFDVAKTPPTVDLAYHRDLPSTEKGALWSCWGDICVADDGKVYCGIGDHSQDSAGKANAFIYEYDPSTRTLRKIVDINAIVPRKHGEPAWSKVHAAITQGADGKIYFTATLNDGGTGGKPQFKWSDDLPGGQLYQYDPVTGKASMFASLPAKRVSATAVMDRQRNIWWCNLEVGGNALYALDLATKKLVFQAPDGSMGFNRNFALAKDGTVYFNAPGGAICRADPAGTGTVTRTQSAFADNRPPPKPRPAHNKKAPATPAVRPPPLIGMRATTAETRDGWIYGCAGRPQEPAQLFRYNPSQDKLEMLGPDFLCGMYTTVCVLSPDERFMYYLPGAHGSAMHCGTPVIQYELATGKRKVLAFLRETIETACGYVAAGTYGVKLSADGGTLYVNFNGHPASAGKKGIGFGLTAFAAIHIPASERPEVKK